MVSVAWWIELVPGDGVTERSDSGELDAAVPWCSDFEGVDAAAAANSGLDLA